MKVPQTQPRDDYEIEDEPLQSSLANSRDFGANSDVGGEESTEDDGFIPVKSKGRKRESK